jgi:hypothetical protein
MITAPVFFAGVTDPALATPLRLAAGDERTGIDLTLPIVPSVVVEGVVSDAAGLPRAGAVVILASTPPIFASGPGINFMQRAVADRQGRYRFASVLPGTYALICAAQAANAAPGPEGHDSHDTPELAAEMSIAVSGEPLRLDIALQPLAKVSGRVAMSGARAAAPVALTVRLEPMGPAISLAEPAQATVKSDGTFIFESVMPGLYRLVPSPGSTLFAQSSVVKGQDSLDMPVEIRTATSIDGWLLTVTESRSELSGVVVDAAGQPVADRSVIAFSSDRRYWSVPTRRVVQVRTGVDGRYQFDGLPAGEYHLIALADVESGEWLVPGFLDPFAGSALRVVVRDGERTRQPLTVPK